VARFASDFLREYDRELFGLTGAQYMTIALVVLGAWFLRTARHRESPTAYRARLEAARAARAEGAAATATPGSPAAEAAAGASPVTARSDRSAAADMAADSAADEAEGDAAPAGPVSGERRTD
jgi:hypothetical protein